MAIPSTRLDLLLSMSILTLTAIVGLIGLLGHASISVPARIKIKPITAEEYLLNEALTPEFR